MGADGHYALATELKKLRERGILFIGSGNLVHNLGAVNWADTAWSWAEEFDTICAEYIGERQDQKLIQYDHLGTAAKLSIPTPEHYYPLLYALGLTEKTETIQWFNNKVTLGSISMRSFIAGS